MIKRNVQNIFMLVLKKLQNVIKTFELYKALKFLELTMQENCIEKINNSHQGVLKEVIFLDIFA